MFSIRNASYRDPSSECLRNVCLQHHCTLTAFNSGRGHGNKENLIATSIAWHPKAVSVAITFGTSQPAPFCTHGGALAIWNLTSEKFQPASPQLCLVAECALQTAAYHPHVPALIAAGTANGGLHVWDLGQESEDVEIGRSASSSNDTMHWRSIKSVAWVYSNDEASRHSEHSKGFVICTVGGYVHELDLYLVYVLHSCSHHAGKEGF